MASPGLRDWDLFCYIPYLTKVNVLDCGKCGWNYTCIAKKRNLSKTDFVFLSIALAIP